MPTVARSLTTALLSGAALCVAPTAFAQQYAVPAGEAIVLDGGAGGGGHVDPRMHTAYRTAAVDADFAAGAAMDGPVMGAPMMGGEVVAEAYPTVRSTQYPTPAGGHVFDVPTYAGSVVSDSVCDGACDVGCDVGHYGEVIYDSGLSGGVPYGGTGYGGGLCDEVCGACGTVGCTPATCDPTCEQDLACGGPVVCNKFGRCGKFYNTATSRQSCGLSAGYAFLFLRPHQGDATAAVVRTPTAAGATSLRQDFDYDLEHGSRIFAELIRPDAVGLRVTWSGLEADSSGRQFAGTTFNAAPGVTSAAIPALFALDTNSPSGRVTADAGDTLITESEVQFSNFDIDATRRLRAGGWLLNTGGGLRFARLDQEYSALVYGANPGEARSSTAFSGAGLTGFAEARRPIGNSGFALVTAGRIALLAGENDTDARVAQNGVVLTGSSDRTDFVPTGELQVGGEWSAWVNPNTLFFTQLAYEGHVWGGVGSPGSQNGNVGFTGFNLTLGLEW
ncbi:Lpg1974 family pore-forming outer membrane protein [Alienimonas sp. DA493]|uniref:Lpg1974 family pore-forming outer membrane protein n=1 Tax=Alienimonas sp. DA493 TaxID=3373605 RepID=UPI003753EDE4